MNISTVITFMATNAMVQLTLSGASAVGFYMAVFEKHWWGFVLAGTTLALKFLVHRMALNTVDSHNN